MNYIRKINYNNHVIVIKAAKSAEQDRCFDCEEKYDMSSFISGVIYNEENTGISESELDRYLLIHVDMAKNYIDRRNKPLTDPSTSEKLLSLGFELANNKNNLMADLRSLGEVPFKNSPEEPLTFTAICEKTGIKYVIDITGCQYRAYRKDGTKI